MNRASKNARVVGFDREANVAALLAADTGKGRWYDFRPDLPNYPRESRRGAAVVDAIVESFCRRNLTFTVGDIKACRDGVPGPLVRGAVDRQLQDLGRDEYIRHCQSGSGYERFPVEELDQFSGRNNGGHKKRAVLSGRDQPESGEIAADSLEEDLSKIEKENVGATTKRALRNARKGTGEFRKAVLHNWGDCCAVTGSMTGEVIEAAHIKPWRDSDENVKERLDPNNGLPLVATFHKLFDAGLISFDPSGKLIVSRKLTSSEQDILGVRENSRLQRSVKEKVKEYLAYHRKKYFENMGPN